MSGLQILILQNLTEETSHKVELTTVKKCPKELCHNLSVLLNIPIVLCK